MEEIIKIQNLIYEVRGQKVMLDSDLAKLYEVETKALNRAVKRNIERFPSFFMFQLTKDETLSLRYQFGTANSGFSEISEKRRYNPYVFTEQGVAMLSSVLRSEKAIEVNIQIMMIFVKIRKYAIENQGLAKRIADIETYLIKHSKTNKEDIDRINQVLNYLTDITKPTKIGFKVKE